jgi:hypothetical protein
LNPKIIFIKPYFIGKTILLFLFQIIVPFVSAYFSI